MINVETLGISVLSTSLDTFNYCAITSFLATFVEPLLHHWKFPQIRLQTWFLEHFCHSLSYIVFFMASGSALEIEPTGRNAARWLNEVFVRPQNHVQCLLKYFLRERNKFWERNWEKKSLKEPKNVSVLESFHRWNRGSRRHDMKIIDLLASYKLCWKRDFIQIQCLVFLSIFATGNYLGKPPIKLPFYTFRLQKAFSHAICIQIFSQSEVNIKLWIYLLHIGNRKKAFIQVVSIFRTLWFDTGLSSKTFLESMAGTFCIIGQWKT